MPCWRIPAPIVGDLQRFQHEVRSFIGIGYEHEDSCYDPLFRWFPEATRKTLVTGIPGPVSIRRPKFRG
jgi:hypothetical protein